MSPEEKAMRRVIIALIVLSALAEQKPRIATKPSRKSRRKRVDDKRRRGEIKRTRGKVDGD